MLKTQGTITALHRFQIRSYEGVASTRRVGCGSPRRKEMVNLIIDPGFVEAADGKIPGLRPIWSPNVGDEEDFLAYPNDRSSESFILFDCHIILHMEELMLLEKIGGIRIKWTKSGFIEKKYGLIGR